MENTNLAVRDSEAIGSLGFTSLKKWQIVAECRDFYLLLIFIKLVILCFPWFCLTQ